MMHDPQTVEKMRVRPKLQSGYRMSINRTHLHKCQFIWPFIILFVLWFLANQLKLSGPDRVSSDENTTSNIKTLTNTAIHPKDEIIDGVNVLWVAPESNSPSGILFVAHGCSHSHTDFFSFCDNCLGLAEEVAIVDIGLNHNLVVVAISSIDRNSKCWQPTHDGPRVANVLTNISKRYQKHNMPIYAFGASSGGAFVSKLGQYIDLNGFLSQIMATRKPHETACMVYLTMNRDTRSDEMAEKILNDSDSNVKHIRLPPIQLTDSFFSDRIPQNIPTPTSTSMYKTLEKEGFLDSDGFLLHNPRRSDWRSFISAFAGDDNLEADGSSISEVMNVAYGQHEMTRDGVAEGLEYCLALQNKKEW